MVGDLLAKYANAQTITIILAGLADDGIAVSNEISNAANLYQDALVQLSIKTGTSVDINGTIRIYAIGSVDGGITWPDNTNQVRKPIAIMDANADSTTFVSVPFSVAQAFFSGLTQKWKIVIENKSGATLDGTEGNHLKKYQGFYGQYT